MRTHKARQVGPQVLRHGRGVGHQAHHSDDALRVIGQVGRQVVHVGQDALRVPVQRLPHQRERDAAGMAFEQLGADPDFKVGHPFAGRPTDSWTRYAPRLVLPVHTIRQNSDSETRSKPVKVHASSTSWAVQAALGRGRQLARRVDGCLALDQM